MPPARSIVIIQGHPDPDPARLGRAMAQAYADGAHAAGHGVQMIDLARLDVPFLRSQAEFTEDAIPDALKPAQAAIAQADHMVLVFPLWLGTMPALVKAFLEQVMRPGIAFEPLEAGSLPAGRFKGKSAHIVTTMSMPAPVYRYVFLSHGLAGLRRNILGFVGYRPVRQTLFGGVETAGDARRRGWIARMEDMGRNAR